MANTFQVVDMVTKEALRIAHETLTFTGTTDRQYDESFRQNGRGKQGASLRVRRPNMYTRRQGSRIMDVQDQDEKSDTLTVATQDGVDMKFNSAELIQSVNSGGKAFDDLSKNYIEPAVKVLVSGIEADYLEFATKATYNVAGSAGTAITTLDVPGKARAKLNQGLAPKSDRCIQLDSVAMGAVVNGVSAYFNPSNAIGEQYREGLISRTSMADWYENERIWNLVNGADVTADTNADALVTDGGNIIAMHTLLPEADQAEGMVFTVAGVYALHPETKKAYGHLQQFTIVEAGGATGTTVSPTIYLTGPRRNVGDSTGAAITAATFNAAELTFVGAASTVYPQHLMYHKEAFQFITADLPLMDDAQKCVRRMQDGLSVRVWMGSDIRNDELLMRLDILYGFAALRPEWACRLIGSAAA